MPTAEAVIPENESLTDRQRVIQLTYGRHPKEVICELSSNGNSDPEIAETLGISEHTLKLWIRDFGIRRRRVLCGQAND